MLVLQEPYFKITEQDVGQNKTAGAQRQMLEAKRGELHQAQDQRALSDSSTNIELVEMENYYEV